MKYLKSKHIFYIFLIASFCIPRSLACAHTSPQINFKGDHGRWNDTSTYSDPFGNSFTPQIVISRTEKSGALYIRAIRRYRVPLQAIPTFLQQYEKLCSAYKQVYMYAESLEHRIFAAQKSSLASLLAICGPIATMPTITQKSLNESAIVQYIYIEGFAFSEVPYTLAHEWYGLQPLEPYNLYNGFMSTVQGEPTLAAALAYYMENCSVSFENQSQAPCTKSRILFRKQISPYCLFTHILKEYKRLESPSGAQISQAYKACIKRWQTICDPKNDGLLVTFSPPNASLAYVSAPNTTEQSKNIVSSLEHMASQLAKNKYLTLSDTTPLKKLTYSVEASPAKGQPIQQCPKTHATPRPTYCPYAQSSVTKWEHKTYFPC